VVLATSMELQEWFIKAQMLMVGQLGIFLCMRCAALHRKLGTHITKVKSLSMDSWSNEQVEVGLWMSVGLEHI
jgi:hypothetical protein